MPQTKTQGLIFSFMMVFCMTVYTIALAQHQLNNAVFGEAIRRMWPEFLIVYLMVNLFVTDCAKKWLFAMSSPGRTSPLSLPSPSRPLPYSSLCLSLLCLQLFCTMDLPVHGSHSGSLQRLSAFPWPGVCRSLRSARWFGCCSAQCLQSSWRNNRHSVKTQPGSDGLPLKNHTLFQTCLF